MFLIKRIRLGLLLSAVLIACCLAAESFAQGVAPVPMPVTVSQSPYQGLVNQIMPYASIVITALAAWVANAVVGYLNTHANFLDAQTKASLCAQIADASSRAGGLAYQVMAQAAGHLADYKTQNVALDTGVAYLNNSFPDAIKTLGLTPDHLQAMVSGELGKLYAGDPSVTIPPKPAVPAATT